MALRIIFMGTPDFAVPTLLALVGQGHEVAAVYTQPPRPAGRGMGERPSPVHQKAQAFGIPVFTPKTLRDPAAQAEFADHDADVTVVVAYGLILPRPILDGPRQGCLNVHASLLPRWRGAAPIQRAIMAGDRETGVMIMRMEEGLDTGPICLGERVAIDADDTAGILHDRLARLGADLTVRALAALERGSLSCTPQPDEGITYAAKIEKAEARLDWRKPAADLANQIRGLAPFPVAWCEMQLGGARERVRILRAAAVAGAGQPGAVLDGERMVVACGGGALRLTLVQRAGRSAVSAEEFARGARIRTGDRLG